MNRLCLVCVGEKYIRHLSENIANVDHEEYTAIHILTNDVIRVREVVENTMLNEKIFLSYVNELEFNYFYKFYFSLDTVIEFKDTVNYVDIMRTELLSKFTPDSNKIGIHYVSPWGPFLYNASLLFDYGCEYFVKGYWNSFIEKLKKIDVSPESIIPITEQLLVVNYHDKLIELKSKLKELENDFIAYSTNYKSVYKKPANGEGLALGFASHILDIPLHLLKKRKNYLI